jgi:ribulose 1,5-bisphosphate synthetase/thiazole synthase
MHSIYFAEKEFTMDVLVVGAGPTGLTLAHELALCVSSSRAPSGWNR